ncbi:MAG: hypothetical protein HN742_00405 [Lentisphaerae bacterium]|nr:hypothetical protein [Lentisphaerota bacterium]MBT4815258.1 hypothetical protein [Lentisphaerota bacterium]MBT5608805.1 hypothetical protein [Lentisphaerota bacterium]MBT7058316.1 hypothetical protein [Lentisphaerota bacterium]MBT7840291.1 hypothetical protein [Lentisphaerota bacterium]
MTFNVHSGWGRRLDTPSRRTVGGTFHLVGQTPEGPWQRPREDLLIGSGCDRHDAVVARSVMWQGQRLLYHHYNGAVSPGTPRALGLPKALAVKDGQRVVRPWAGLKGLWMEQLALSAPRQPDAGPFSNGTWNIGGETIGGGCPAGATMLLVEGAPDLDAVVNVSIADGPRAGVAVGGDELSKGALLVLLDCEHNAITLNEVRAGMFGPSFGRPLDAVHRPLRNNAPYAVRIVKRDRYAEIFVNGELLFSTITEGIGRGNWLALVADSAQAHFQIKRAHRIKPMKR